MRHVVRIGHDVFREAAIPRVPAERRLGTDRLACSGTVLAVAAGAVEPGDAHALAFLDRRDARAEGRHDADAFMPRREWQPGLQQPVFIGGVQVGMADAAGLGLHQDLAPTRCGDVEFPEDERLAELLDDDGVHLECHEGYLAGSCETRLSAAS